MTDLVLGTGPHGPLLLPAERLAGSTIICGSAALMAATVVAEEWLVSRRRLIAVDDRRWWPGLRRRHDGGPGFRLPVFGAEEGLVISADDGAAVAEAVAPAHSAIIALWRLPARQHQRFRAE